MKLRNPEEKFSERLVPSEYKVKGKQVEDYEALALRFATDPLLRSGLRERLRKNRLENSLFDTDRFCRNIEAAYTTMWELWQRGERPRSFSVPV
jgi:hypothetical protein